MQSVSEKVAAKVMRERKPKRGVDNRTSILRQMANKRRIRDNQGGSEMRSGPSNAGYQSFDSRSRSVLPPIRSQRGSERASDYEELKSDMRNRN